MKALVTAVALLASTSVLADSGWIYVTTASNDARWEIKAQSLNVSKNSSGVVVAIATIRVIDKDGSTVFGLAGFPLETCTEGMGQLTVFTVQGKIAAKYDVVANGGTVASNMVDAMCAAIKSATNKPAVHSGETNL